MAIQSSVDAKYRCHLYFNHRCKENYVLPSSLRFRPPLRNAKGYKLMVRTDFSFLKLRIDKCHSSMLWLRALFFRSLSELSALINNSKTSWVKTKNIQKDVLNALIPLKEDPDRLVLSADKSNCVVVMEKQQYHDKALTLLNDESTYAVLNSDPTNKAQRKFKKMLLDLKKAGEISDYTYKMLYSSDDLRPCFYGLPTIHKPGIPFKPIVSFF